jgi:phosphoribosyl-AMP cyclohydrolase
MTTKELLEKLDFNKGNGLIPVIVQDAKTKEVISFSKGSLLDIARPLKKK